MPRLWKLSKANYQASLFSLKSSASDQLQFLTEKTLSYDASGELNQPVLVANGKCKPSTGNRALLQYPIRRLFVRSRKVAKRDLYLEFDDRSEIWYLGSSTAYVPVKFKASRLHEILR